jgi:hypothetical protein
VQLLQKKNNPNYWDEMLAIWRLLPATFFLIQIHHPARGSCLPECECLSETIDCSSNDFTTIPSNDLLNGSLYTALNISFNRIQILEKNSFIKRGYAALETLDISNNNISDINPYAFTGLDKIKKLILGHNNLLSLQQDVFQPLINLKELDLQRNKLSTVLPQTMSPMKKLLYLDLRYNKLTDFDEGTFTNLSVLEKLKLTGNVIRNFAPEKFKSLKNLQYLEVQLFETSNEEQELAASKSELPSCLCKRKTALDWCHENRVKCIVTCSYLHEDQYDKDSSVCLNMLGAFTAVETNKSTADLGSELLWALTITIGVFFLLFIALIVLVLLFLKSEAHTGDESCTVVSNLETFDSYTTAAEQ